MRELLPIRRRIRVPPPRPPVKRSGPEHWQRYDEGMWAGVQWESGTVYVAATDPCKLPDTFHDVFAKGD